MNVMINKKLRMRNSDVGNQIETLEDITKLKPVFSMYGGMEMVDWFEVHLGDVYCIIHSGLRHADGETKSPYHYEHTSVGNDSVQDAINHFKIWWGSKWN